MGRREWREGSEIEDCYLGVKMMIGMMGRK
jgi:hypothetical protein